MKSTTKGNALLIMLVILVTVPFWLSISAVLDIDTRIGIQPYVDYLLVLGNSGVLLTSLWCYRKTKNKINLVVVVLSTLMLLSYIAITLTSIYIFG